MLLKICPFIISFNLVIGYSIDRKTEVLTNNFFENLRGDPKLLNDYHLSDSSKQFIDKQIQNYLNLVTNGKLGSVKTKRSLLENLTKDRGTYLLKAITPSATIPSTFPLDIAIFQQNSQWYAAALESLEINENANNLVIYHYKNGTFTEEVRRSVSNGVKLAVMNVDNFTLIAVAENDNFKDNFHEKSGIYQYVAPELFKIQSIDMNYASDVVMWRIHDEIYMSIAQFMSNQIGNIHYETDIPIFKWLGKHFDLMQNIKNRGVRKITPFAIDHVHYLAIANFKNDSGETKIYSEIYKFNHHIEQYQLYQRIQTRACTDIKYFHFSQDNRMKDYFLIVANSYTQDSNGNINYDTDDSILYKFVDNYFIPFQSFQLNAVEEWLPIEGPNKEFVLFASCRFDGLKSFQYDGWTFREIPQKTNEILSGTGIKSIRSTNFLNTTSLVVANKKNSGNVANLFVLEFTHHDTLNGIYHDMITWCETGLGNVETMAKSAIFDDVLEKAERADIDEEPLNSNIINSKIDSLHSLLDQFEKSPVSLDGVTADWVLFNNSAIINDLITTKINDLEMGHFVENTLDIKKGFDIDELDFDSATIKGSFIPKTINSRNSSDLIHRTDDLNLNNLIIHGNLIASEGLKIKGKLNGVVIDSRNLLLTEGKQNFSKPVTLHGTKINQMKAKSLNGHLEESKIINADYIETLTVKNFNIGGYINDVDIPTLVKYALMKSGNQEISALYIFDDIKGKNLEVEGKLSGLKLSDLIPIDGGNFTINQDLIFKNNLTVDKLQVSDFVNGIDIEDGKPNILLKDHPEEQHISGEKIFDDLVIYNPIELQGKIKSEQLEKMNPVVTIDDDITLEGDRIITGHVLVENMVNTEDMTTPGGHHSLTKLEAKGLKLTEKEIHPHLHFIQQMNVDEVFVDQINGRDPRSFVINRGEDTQIIQGRKTFIGDLQVTGPTTAFKINDVIVQELENNVMKLDGDQKILGEHHIKHIIVDKISSKNPRFGAKNLNRGGTKQNVSNTKTIDGDFETNIISTKKMTVKGLINDLDFNKIVDDTVMRNSTSVVGGKKIFDNLTIDALVSDQCIKLAKFDEILNNKEFRLDGSFKIKNSITIENFYFNKTCNGINKHNFGKDNIDENGTQIVDGDRIFGTIVVYGETLINSNKINDVGILDLVENTVKVDEPFEFNAATFETVISKGPTILNGQIENVDLDNVVLSNSDFEQIMFDEKIFKNNLTINGSVHFGGYVNGLNISQLCEFAMDTKSESKDLIVDGNAFFAKGPIINLINNISVSDIWENAWFDNRDTVLTGYVEFDKVIFTNDITIRGFVDNISLSLLSKNYLSKSKNQRIAATFNFKNLIFENNVTVPDMTLDGTVNDINLDEFTRTVLLDDYDQVFETVLYLENCKIKNLTGNFKVNNLDLQQDVMRYDKTNLVTGAKFFENLNVELLKIDKNIKIQNVDVLDWFKSAVLKEGTYNITAGKSLRKSSFANGIQLTGTLNGAHFDTENIMVKNIPQNITATKTFFTGIFDSVIFKSIKLKGLINGIDLHDLIDKQAYKNSDNVFKSTINLHNNITTNNLVIEKSYQGINVSELIANVTNLGALNNLLERYNSLLMMSHKLETSIRAQAYFIHHYKILQTIPLVDTMKISCPDGATRISAVKSGDPGIVMDLYGWNVQQELFLKDESMTFDFKNLKYIDQVMMGRYLYIEENDGYGHFTPMDNSLSKITIPTNATRSTTSFTIPTTNEICTLFIYYKDNPKIFCEKEEDIRLMQILETSEIFRASSITIQNTLYLITINIPVKIMDPTVDLWVFNNKTNNFEIHQSLFETEPKSVATVHYNNDYYLAIASGHLYNAMYSGRVELRQFDKQTQRFLPWQSIELDAPIQVEFSILPSNELILYVVTDNPTEPLLVFRYEGIAGFKQKIVASTLPKILYINQFMGGTDQHFIVAQGYTEVNVIQAIFKGERLTDE